MHHTPAGPPLSARIRSALHRWIPVGRSAFPFRMRRVVPALLIGTATALIAVVAFAVPALSGSRPPVALDSSSSNSAEGPSPVVLGEDGQAPAGTPTAEQHRSTAPSSAAPGGQSGTVTAEPHHPGTAPATSEATGAPTLAGSAAPAGTSSPPASSSPPPSSSSSVPFSSAPSSSSSVPFSSAPSSSSPSAPSTSSPPSSSSAPPTASPRYSGSVLTLVNAARAEAGCADLTTDADLSSAAVANSAAMAAQGELGVVDAAGTDSAIASGEPDADSVVSAWLADSTDHTTLLDCSLTKAGVGRAAGDGGPWWTLFLA